MGDERAIASAGDPVGHHGCSDRRLVPIAYLARRVDQEPVP